MRGVPNNFATGSFVSEILTAHKIKTVYFVIVAQWSILLACTLMATDDHDWESFVVLVVMFVSGVIASVLGPIIIERVEWTWVLIIFAALLILPFWVIDDPQDKLGAMVTLALLFIFGAIIAGLVGRAQGVAIEIAICFGIIVYLTESGEKVISQSSSKNLFERILNVFDRRVYSRMVIGFTATCRMFPLRGNKFIGFCVDAFLLKRSMDDVEFVHRLLRDYFALEPNPIILYRPDNHRI